MIIQNMKSSTGVFAPSRWIKSQNYSRKKHSTRKQKTQEVKDHSRIENDKKKLDDIK